MAAWAGFSDEELRRMQQKEHSESVTSSIGRGRRSTATNRSRQQLQREKALQMAAKNKAALSESPLSPEQQLQPPSPPPLQASPPISSSQTNPEKVPKQDLQEQDPDYRDPTAAVKELEKQEVELREKTRLQHLQWEQRMMEEKNKRTKALLAKTIAEKYITHQCSFSTKSYSVFSVCRNIYTSFPLSVYRSKQTQAEAIKLKKIQKELQVLDDSVSSDIGVLRGLIEQASMEYSTAWKRMEKAEAEYVAAKLDLHKKTEIKEQLTEHLCAIIQQNELRKARKLEELMLQLELSTEQVIQTVQEEACGEKQGPAHTATENLTQENREVVCKDVSIERDETNAKTSGSQETILLTAAASDQA
ncbi:RAB6-interacting golgin [Bagarius yarrelli]|uniref:RAB6-interacting golgin n=1 Tax=Bagarius yarrelli TaxID=175774 RepID=A0A556U7E6_BAGYA|nr:RAB6-interacting golgin [Bagarius yarrelli]